jgi:hypothetical protein
MEQSPYVRMYDSYRYDEFLLFHITGRECFA